MAFWGVGVCRPHGVLHLEVPRSFADDGCRLLLARLDACRRSDQFPESASPWDWDWLARAATSIVLGLPCFALFARRMHDQGFTAWWTLLLLPLPAINLYQSYRAVFAVRNPSWLQEPRPLEDWSLWLFASALVLLVLFLRPGTLGPNHYGPDPRQATCA